MLTKEQHIKSKLRTVCGEVGVEVDKLQVSQIRSQQAGEMNYLETVKRRREPYVNY